MSEVWIEDIVVSSKPVAKLSPQEVPDIGEKLRVMQPVLFRGYLANIYIEIKGKSPIWPLG